jgi:hypothetical protein
MAKKRKRRIDKDEKYVFKMPEFDVKEFLQDELKESKVMLFTVIYAIIIAGLSLFITIYVAVVLAFIIGIISLITIKYAYRFANIEIPKPDWKKWVGYGAMFFFMWLAVWIMLCNPPFTDLTKPVVSDVRFQVLSNDVWKDEPVKNITQGSTVRIVFNVSDNYKLDISSLSIAYDDRPIKHKQITQIDGTYQCSFKIDKITEGKHEFVVSIKDAKGNKAVYTETFYISS